MNTFNPFTSPFSFIGETALKNVAALKFAYQSSQMENYAAFRAVDGISITDTAAHSCSNTAEGDAHPWWAVDLQGEYQLDSVVLVDADEGFGEECNCYSTSMHGAVTKEM